MLKRARHHAAWAVVVVVAALTIGTGGGVASPGAHAAKRKTVNVRTTANLSLVKKRGNVLKERGTATGTLAGSVKARFDISNAAKTTGSVTFYPNGGGSLTVTVVGYPQSVGTVARFSGSLAVRKGTGRFSDATGSGTFTGTVNRRTWHITVNASSRLTY